MDVADADPTGSVGLTVGNFTHFARQAVGNPLDARAVFEVDVSFERMVDLRTSKALAVLNAFGIKPEDLVVDNYGPCPAIAVAGEQLGWQAIRAQSAAYTAGTAVAIFRDAFPPRDAWRLVEAEGRPTVRTAFLTRYRASERPAWLAA
jgi:hypothetical protein